MPNYPQSLSVQTDKRQEPRANSPEIESSSKQTSIKQYPRSDSIEPASVSIQENKKEAARQNSALIQSSSKQTNKKQKNRPSSSSTQSLSAQTNIRQQSWSNSPELQSSSVQSEKKSASRSSSTGVESSSIQIDKRQTARSSLPKPQSYTNQEKSKGSEVRRNSQRTESSAVVEKMKSENRPFTMNTVNAKNSPAKAKQRSKRAIYSDSPFVKEVVDENGNVTGIRKFELNDAATQPNQSPDVQEAKKSSPRINVKSRILFGNNLSCINNVLWANSIYDRQDIKWYEKFNRFGALDPYNAISGTREYIFFTKPDLHIVEPGTDKLNPELANQPFFNELHNRYSSVITQLQSSNGYTTGNYTPFMAILSNAVKNTLEIPSISANTVDTPENIYGTSYNYRGWGYGSDEKIEFSLEFEDSKYLEIYNLVKAYEEYERLKHIGSVTPPNLYGGFNFYIQNKILHDQFSVYKFIVEDDGETLIYYAKLWGVFFKNVPREAFSDMKVDGGLTYTIDFEAAFIDDMNPTILTDFNKLVEPYADRYPDDLPIYNINNRMIDGRWASLPVVVKQSNIGRKTWNGPSNMSHIYKLKWRV